MDANIGYTYPMSISRTYEEFGETSAVRRKSHDHNQGNVWTRLKEAMIAAGVRKPTQTTAAKLLGIKQSSISGWSKGKSWPSVEHLQKLCQEYNCNVTWLLSDIGEMHPKPPEDPEAILIWRYWHYLDEKTKVRLATIAEENARDFPNGKSLDLQ